MARKPRKKINRDVDTPQQTESESTVDIGSVDSPRAGQARILYKVQIVKVTKAVLERNFDKD